MSYDKALAAMAVHGLAPESLRTDGRIHRFRGEDDKRGKKNAWYLAFDNPLVVTYGSWKDPDARYTFCESGETQPSDEDRKRIAAAMEQRKIEDAKRKRRNAARISRIWEAATPAKRHKYLTAKQIKAHGARTFGKRLVIAMRNSQREVVGLQLIYPNGFKRYMKGSQPTGSYYGIGKPNGTLYICEGFATGATVYELTGSAVAVAFSSGNLGSVTRAMRANLPDTKIVICADNDQWTTIRIAAGDQPNPGVYYATQAANQSGCELRIPEFSDVETKPTDFNDLRALEGDDTAKQQLTGTAKPAQDETPLETAVSSYKPFKALGYDGDGYYYLPRRTNRVCSISASGHGSKANLLALAPLEWWEHEFPAKTGADWLMAANYCMRECEQRGAYNPSNVRGCGAWFDEGRSVLHLGDRLLVDYQSTDISDLATRFIYESKAPMENQIQAKAATIDQGKQLVELFNQIRFEKPVHALLCAGWVTLAPVCGALKWRPHIWLTGRRGTGKSWIQHNLIEPLIGSIALMVQANSTEAGIRQRLQLDARPVVFDEAEAESNQDKRRIQSIIELARQASSESTAEIAKGTSGGAAMSFRARSMFMLGSINVNLSMAADETRFSVLSLKNPSRAPSEIQRFKDFEKQVHATITDDFCAAIRSRTYQMIPTIRKNASCFAQAVAEAIGSQRIGDQVGTLLAGVCALTSDDEINLQQARAWIKGIDFSDAEDADEASDEERCLQHLLEAKVRLQRGERSIAELLRTCMYGIGASDEITESFDTLVRHGLKPDGSALFVSNTHTGIKELLKDSPWSGSWSRVLRRLEIAESHNSMRFAGVVSKCVKLTIGEIITSET